LLEALEGSSAPAAQGKLKRPRDFTNNIKIGGEVFTMETVKGKKQVLLPWERLSRIRDSGGAENMEMYKGLRGKILLEAGGRSFTLLAGEKLTLILSLLPSLDVENAPDRNWPRKRIFNSRKDLPSLLDWLPLLVNPAVWKQGKRELGFLCLFTDGGGNYRFKCSRGFHTSLNESLASVETLIDELGEDVDIAMKHVVNQTYRRLSDYLN
jgi:hypothetical protein